LFLRATEDASRVLTRRLSETQSVPYAIIKHLKVHKKLSCR